MCPKYNLIYDKLVDGKDDIEGQIAYSLYKEDKKEFIKDYKERNGGKDPLEADMKSFYNFICLDVQIEKYKLLAHDITIDFLNSVLKDSKDQIEQSTIMRHKELLTEVIEPISPPSKTKQFWHGVGQSILGAFAFSLILAAFGFIAWFKAGDLNVSFNNKEDDKNIKEASAQIILPNDTIYQY